MRFYSTRNPSITFDPAMAILRSLPEDNGLFMPERIPLMPEGFFADIRSMQLPEIAYEVAVRYFSPEIPAEVIRTIVDDAVNFPVPVKHIHADTHVLELFHGPTLAFKDMGARFMARLMSWLNRNEAEKLTVLVATSGDTGSAVASGFYGVEGIEVVILYPSGKVSPLQEKQLTTNGGNIRALEIQGSFDDCQRIVKTAFLDKELNTRYRLTSANSINIARLIPQSFYYIDALRQVPEGSIPPVFVVPSGNFGNLTAGLLAQRSGMPASGFIAATNRNDAVVRYLSGEDYQPHETIATISNAMDVGNPSNFVRLLDMFGNERAQMQHALQACTFDDEATRSAMRECYSQYGYMLDPHAAVGWLAWAQLQSGFQNGTPGLILETAHPVKFSEVVEETLGVKPEIPESLLSIMSREKQASLLSSNYSDFLDWMMGKR
ncbi:MAG: threonine synthase [Bacteroidota bacterium]